MTVDRANARRDCKFLAEGLIDAKICSMYLSLVGNVNVSDENFHGNRG